MTARLWLLAAVLAACKTEDPGTSIRVTLRYADDLGLDTADVTLSDRGSSGRIAHELLLLVPDELAGQTMPITVWGRKDDRRSAYGETTATTTRDETVTAEVTLTACTPSCEGKVLTSCVSEPVACPLGCSAEGDAHCVGPVPSNGVDIALLEPVRGTTSIDGATTFNTDTGEIVGDLSRAAGTGLVSGIGYYSQVQGGVPVGVFVFRSLAVAKGVQVSFTGARGVVFLVDSASIAGDLDLDAGHGRQDLPGAGGGAGSTERGMAGGCAPGTRDGAGKDGTQSDLYDSGAGGGGHVDDGAPGGAGGNGATSPGDGGPMCADADFLQPLIGGGGGGKGAPGASATAASGGGGGGAIQITALNQLTVSGVIHASGAGGEGGTMSISNGGGGAGGGAGGSILLESPILTLTGATLAAKGAGGGGDGGAQPVLPGQNGGTSAEVPQGSIANDAGGGTGGANSGPDVGTTGAYDGGGGGGGRGRIVLRSESATLTGGTFTPRPDQARVRR